MRYNARDCGVQLSVNLISRLEEEGPTRLYACQSGFEPTTKRFESRALVSSATREAPDKMMLFQDILLYINIY